MPKRTLKQPTKSAQTVKKNSIEPNVAVYTDLPPDVHGQLRCYLVLKVDRFVWTGPRMQNELNIVLKWWGELSQGTVFRCSRFPGIAKYAIKCGPRQFSSYLNDMEALSLDFIDSKSYRIQGVAKVDVRKLSKDNLILTDATIRAPLSDKVLGKLNVSLNIVQAPKSLSDQPTLDKNSPLKVSSAIQHPRTSSAKTSPIKFSDDKENIAFPSKNIQKNSVTDIINQVLNKSRRLKDELVKAQMKDLDHSDNIREEIEANMDTISPNCIKEVEREQINETQPDSTQVDNTMDLFFGRNHIDSMLKKHGLDVSFSSESSASSFHDESLIEHLFYKRGQDHDIYSVSSDSEVDESAIGTQKNKSSRVKFASPKKNAEESFAPVEENLRLSLNKITALGRVNKCKLFLSDLMFDGPAQSGTYFVEYKIPIADEEETKTLTSRKVEDKSVNFDHSNVFPVMFDEVLINQWEVRTAGFKVFYKERIEDSPELIADASLKLKNVLLVENFDLKFALQMRSIQTDDYLGLLNGVLKLHSGDVSEIFVPRSNPPQKPKAISLNLLISVVCGKAIQTKNKEVVNSYVVARMIDSVERLTTDVVWDSNHPVYNCKHIIPFTYTQTFIDRLKDNFIILEVWNKSGTSDDLVGLCKLPTSQFNLSLSGENLQTFVDENVPLVAVDGYMPIIDILSNQRCGILQCILAVGSHSQLTDLLSQKNLPPVIVPKTPAEKPESVEPEITSKTRHMFHVTVNSVQDMDMFEGSSWGATDCFISFTLPVSAGVAPPELKTYTTSISSAAPHMKFNHRTTSSLVLSDAVSVQQYLSSTLEDNSVVFELWRRFYYPNVRDQVCARGLVTLQQLSHLISLNPGTEQGFKVPLNTVQIADDDGLGYLVGTLSISVEYNQDTVTETQNATNFVQFCVGVQRACGLQYAAQRALSAGAPVEHAATVGVDSYVAIELSFAGIDRESSVRARSFTPNYGAHFSMTLPTVMSATHSGPPTLAENISKGSVLVSVFHRVEGSQGKANDILLCKATVSLESLLQKQSGLHGWVSLQEPTKSREHVASIELEIGFSELTEREQVIQDACGRGWVPPPLPSITSPYLSLDIGVDRVWIPDTILLRYRGAQDIVYEDRQCYLRIKFYNSEAVCSDLINFSDVVLDKRSYSDVEFRTTFNFTVSTNLVWCLREEPLEIQVWLVPRGGKDDTIGDTILGCGYVSLSELLAANHTPSTAAQVAPLVKATSPSLGGAGLHVTTTLTELQELPAEEPSEPVKPVISLAADPELSELEVEPEEEIEGIQFRVSVSQCTDLPTDQYDLTSLCVYCSVLCQTHTLLTTPYREFTPSVLFNCTQDLKIPYTVLSGSDNTVRCVVSAHDLATQSDLCVVGTATVDLAPLLIGFPCVEGWYLVEDVYSKDTFGTIKVSFTPLELVSKEIISSKIEELEQSLVAEQNVPTNFLKKVVAKRSDYLVPNSDQMSEPPENSLKIENVFQSLADIDELIKNIGIGKVNLNTVDERQGEPEVTEVDTEPEKISSNSQSLKSSSTSSSSSSSSKSSSSKSSSSKASSQKSQDNSSQSSQQPEVLESDPTTAELLEPEAEPEEVVLDSTLINQHATTTLIEEEPDLLLDTFDITVDTDCLSDTVSDITQLLQDVQRQTQNIDSILESVPQVEDQLAEQVRPTDCVPGHDEVCFDGADNDNVLYGDVGVLPVEHEEVQVDMTNEEGVESGDSTENIPESKPAGDGDRITALEIDEDSPRIVSDDVAQPSPHSDQDLGDIVEEVTEKTPLESSTSPQDTAPSAEEQPEILCRPNRNKIENQFKRPLVPDFFMAAKELSTTINELKRQRQPSKSNESQESDARSSTPILCRRTPLTRLMGQGPDNDQRARIARIFRQ